MNKTWLITKREYLTRVKKKTFILSTFLTPLLFAGVIAAIVFITIHNSDKEKIAVIDNSGVFKKPLDSLKSVKFELNPAIATLSNFYRHGYSAILFAPHTRDNHTDDWLLYSRKSFGVITTEQINEKIRREIENDMLLMKFRVSNDKIDSIRTSTNKIKVVPKRLAENAKIENGDSVLAYIVGYAASFLIYITLFIYGAMVMRGVMEEKTNRIAEVIVSSVKPFQLMIGKIVGIGAVGLTQFLLWIVLIVVFSAIIGALIPPEVLLQARHAGSQLPGGEKNEAMMQMASTIHNFSTVNWPLIVGCFLFYFVCGYLFYAALFAAVGSAINEDPQDAQSLMFPITMPLILAIIIMINAITHPESGLATWSSIIPFFSPIVMMARIPFGVPGTVPWWQLALSMALLVGGFLFTTWLSAKIYRTAILMYGKKITWKEMWKWGTRSS
ncbi:MAG TPA: ABC transporter permease [Chitinophagaceae bacterium]|nr:ABC transporter permease [Chitinophagaceae bacterium]